MKTQELLSGFEFDNLSMRTIGEKQNTACANNCMHRKMIKSTLKLDSNYLIENYANDFCL